MVEGPCWPCPLQSGTVTVTLSCLSWSPKCWEEEGSRGDGQSCPLPSCLCSKHAQGHPQQLQDVFWVCFSFGSFKPSSCQSQALCYPLRYWLYLQA